MNHCSGYMSELIEKDNFIDIVNKGEQALNKCFNMLLAIKNVTPDAGKAIMEFQSVLAESLYEMMKVYLQLKRVEDSLIQQKNSMPSKEFRCKISENANYKHVIKEIINIGKSFGDAFAWFFFKNNRQELDKHFAHEPTGLFVSGIGGEGEIEFIKNTQSIDGLFVVYHGITNMLRIGDFSLYALGKGIVGVGELKTKREGNRLVVSAHITSKVKIKRPDNADKDNFSSEERSRQLAGSFPALLRQIIEQEMLIKTKDSDHTVSMPADFEYDLINTLSPDSPTSINSDKTLLLFAGWSRYRKLYDVLTKEETIDNSEQVDKVKEAALQLIVPESKYNEFLITRIDTQLISSRIPILWWPIKEDICRMIYFKEITIYSILNPAKLMSMFINEGFQVARFGKSDEIELEKDNDGKHMRFGSLAMYLDMIHYSLMKTTSVFETAKRFFDDFEAGNLPMGTKVDMHIHLDCSKPENE